jgi:hypothetical protein
VAEELNGCLPGDTLFLVDHEAVLLQQGKNLAQVAVVKSLAGAGDEDLSRYMNVKGRPPSSESMSRWNVMPAFFKPKGLRTNSNRPKGVIITVLAMSAAAIGI